jgi:CheY-like chemotaxis protein
MAGANILIVDPVKIDADILKSILVHLGHETVTALTIEDARSARRARRFDLIICEQRIAEAYKDIFDTADECSDARAPALVALTSSGSTRWVFQTHITPCPRIGKPYRVDRIRNQIDNILKNGSAANNHIQDVRAGEFQPVLDKDVITASLIAFHDEAERFSRLAERDDFIPAADVAHRLISFACVLGFPELGRACQVFEHAVRDHRDARSASRIVLGHVDALRNEAAHPGPGHSESPNAYPT